MNSRATLVLSLLLNAALLAAGAWLVQMRVLVPAPAAARTLVREVTLAPRTGPARRTPGLILPAPPASAPAAAAAPFHWRQLESADYHQFIANLRAVGCPEKTIADIILADVEKQYAQRRKAVEHGGKFWPTGKRPADLAREREQQLNQLEDEQAGLIQELLGREWQREVGEESLEERAITEFIFGFLPGDKPERVIATFARYGKLMDRFASERDHLLFPEDKEQLRQLYRRGEADFARFLTAAERDEGELRLVGFVAFFDSKLTAKDLAGFELTGAEFREVVRAQMTGEHPLKKEFGWDDEFTPEQETERKAQLEERFHALLGDARYAELKRAQDGRFKEVFNVTEGHELPRAVAVKVYELRLAAEEQAFQIRDDATLTDEQRAAQLTALRTATEQGSAAALGAKAGLDYLKGGEKWLKRLATP